MSATVTSFRGNSDETNTSSVSTIGGGRPSNLSGATTESVEMRNSSIHPSSQEDGIAERETRAGDSMTLDDSDGMNPLTAESFAPLLSTNQYTVRKLAAQALMDVALMMANISQLRTLIAAGPENMEYYYVLICMVGFSLGAQVIFAVLIFIIFIRESEQHQKDEFNASLRLIVENRGRQPTQEDKERIRASLARRDADYESHQITNRLNYVTMVIVFLITVANMFITGFGIELEPSKTSPSTG